MTCVHFPSELRLNPVNPQNGLCSVCEKIDFTRICQTDCPACSTHYHLGSLRDILKDETLATYWRNPCAGCRLILSSCLSRFDSRHCEAEALLQEDVTLSSHDFALQRNPDATGWIDWIMEKVGYRPVLGMEEKSIAFKLLNYVGISRYNQCRSTFPAGIEIRVHPGLQSQSRTGEVVGYILCAEPQATYDIIEKSRPVQLVGRQIKSKIDIDMVRQWIQQCESHHGPSCGKVALELGPTQGVKVRFIDVQELKIVSLTLVERYLALSYVWGGVPPVLTSLTLESLSSPGGLMEDTLPRTISDAIRLVRRIGERYLWVDSLCIIQDDPIDKVNQLHIMDRIFRSAHTVIIAATGDNANSGLPGVSSARESTWQCAENVLGLNLMSVQPEAQKVVGSSVWNRRGWTFQESRLAKRTLTITSQQVHWNCYIDLWSEDKYLTSSTVVPIQDDQTSSFWINPINQNRRVCPLRDYCVTVERYTPRLFSREEDALWAFMGIIKLLKKDFPKGFIWCHPHEQLDATLLWTPVKNCACIHKRSALHTIVVEGKSSSMPFPSWSWLSCQVGVAYEDPCKDNIAVKSEVEWHEPMRFRPDKDTSNNRDPVFENRRQSYWLHDDDIVHLAYLHFTAEYTFLELNPTSYDGVVPGQGTQCIATVQFPGGEAIGKILAPCDLFSSGMKHIGEFILLSSYSSNKSCRASDRSPRRDAHHLLQHVNIMFIEWKQGIAYRVSITKVHKDAWKKTNAKRKRIILG